MRCSAVELIPDNSYFFMEVRRKLVRKSLEKLWYEEVMIYVFPKSLSVTWKSCLSFVQSAILELKYAKLKLKYAINIKLVNVEI